MARIKGLELLFSLKQKELKSKGDCVISAVHCILINADVCCVGTGEEFPEQVSEATTELLPEKWNECQDVYCLRYRSKDLKNRYLLKAVKAGNNLHVNLVLNEEHFSGITINLDEFVSDDYSQFSNAYQNLDKLNENFNKDVLKKISAGSVPPSANKDKEKSTKKSSKSQKPDPIPTAVPIPTVEPIPVGVPDSRRHGGYPSFAIPQVGGSDLDPLGRRGGGMLFDPSGMPANPFGMGRPGQGRPMGLPPHAVPPGARFDPFSPISPDRFNPDPDHFRPPDYDNMFM